MNTSTKREQALNELFDLRAQGEELIDAMKESETFGSLSTLDQEVVVDEYFQFLLANIPDYPEGYSLGDQL